VFNKKRWRGTSDEEIEGLGECEKYGVRASQMSGIGMENLQIYNSTIKQ